MRVQNSPIINQSQFKKSPSFKDKLNVDTSRIVTPKNQLPELGSVESLGHKILISRHLKLHLMLI